MFGMDDTKIQGDEAPQPAGQPEDVIISPDTRRDKRIPPGQSRTKKWPILDAYGAPNVDLTKWRMRVWGLVNQDVESQLVYGSGRAYGIELFLKKKYGRFNGWIGYTLSRTENKFAAICNKLRPKIRKCYP